MKKIAKLAAVPMALMSVLTGKAEAESYWDWQSEFAQIVAAGKVSLDVRYRLETVDQDNLLDDATAATIRTRLGYLTGAYKGFQGFVELEDVSEAGSDDYFDGNGVNTKMRSALVDPDGTELNQFFLRYNGIPRFSLTGGRQKVALDNHRFIGDVGWRQNQQTYDGFTAISTLIPKTTLTYGYLYNANTIFGEDNSLRSDIDMDTHIFNANFKAFPWLTTIGYAYLLDFNELAPNIPAEPASTQTYGVRLAGEKPFGDFKVLYTGEYAHQSDYQDGNPDIDADYYLIEPGVSIFGVTAKLGYEVLGSNDEGTIGFATPLATLHAFQGWADIFLVTPSQGIEDYYVSLGYTPTNFLAGLKLLAFYHDFSAEEGSGDFGSEIDLQASYTFLKYYTFLLKYATYDAGDDVIPGLNSANVVDTDKFWASLEFKF